MLSSLRDGASAGVSTEAGREVGNFRLNPSPRVQQLGILLWGSVLAKGELPGVSWRFWGSAALPLALWRW